MGFMNPKALSRQRRSNLCGFFSETASLPRSSTPSIESHTYSPPFSVESTHAIRSTTR